MSKLLCTLAVAALIALPAAADDVGDIFGKQAKYHMPSVDAVKARVTAWLEQAGAPAELRKKTSELWSAEMADPNGTKLLQRLGETFSLADANAKSIVEQTAKPHDRQYLPNVGWLIDDKAANKLDPFFRDNLRLIIGRWLCQERLYDETLRVLRDVKPENVVDPASLFFYQGVACHRLLVKKEGLEAIRGLLEDVADKPQRYTQVAGLMQQDLMALKDGSLDDISRRMEDVERRLGLHRAGKVVRQKEDEIVTMLDKLIKELEDQQGQCPNGGPGPGGPQNPASSPTRGGIKGPGNVDPKNNKGTGWGALNPKQREEALQQLGKDFPAHYRAAIEQYFRKIADEEFQTGRR
jgi:hypothetical protein